MQLQPPNQPATPCLAQSITNCASARQLPICALYIKDKRKVTLTSPPSYPPMPFSPRKCDGQSVSSTPCPSFLTTPTSTLHSLPHPLTKANIAQPISSSKHQTPDPSLRRRRLLNSGPTRLNLKHDLRPPRQPDPGTKKQTPRLAPRHPRLSNAYPRSHDEMPHGSGSIHALWGRRLDPRAQGSR